MTTSTIAETRQPGRGGHVAHRRVHCHRIRGPRAVRVPPRGRLATALVALVAAVALFGLAFPGLLAPAVAIAVLAAIIALDWLLPSGELRQVSARFWKR